MAGLNDLLNPPPKSSPSSTSLGGLNALSGPPPSEVTPKPSTPRKPALRNTVESLGYEIGIGDKIYNSEPDAIVDAIYQAEGVPSYGNMKLAARYGGHRRVPEDVGREATARLVSLRHREWVERGKPGDFLDYLRDRYAPAIGATNDPTGLNTNWLPNVLKNLRVVAKPRTPAPAASGTPQVSLVDTRAPSFETGRPARRSTSMTPTIVERQPERPIAAAPESKQQPQGLGIIRNLLTPAAGFGPGGPSRAREEKPGYVAASTKPVPEAAKPAFGTVRDVIERSEAAFRDIPRSTVSGDTIEVPVGRFKIPVPVSLLEALQTVNLGSQVIEAELTKGRGYRAVFKDWGLQDTGSFGPAAVAAGIVAGILDPINLLTLGSGVLTTSGRRAIEEAARVRAMQRGAVVRPQKPSVAPAPEPVPSAAAEAGHVVTPQPAPVAAAPPVPAAAPAGTVSVPSSLKERIRDLKQTKAEILAEGSRTAVDPDEIANLDHQIAGLEAQLGMKSAPTPSPAPVKQKKGPSLPQHVRTELKSMLRDVEEGTPGQRIPIRDKEGYIAGWTAEKSTYPNWMAGRAGENVKKAINDALRGHRTKAADDILNLAKERAEQGYNHPIYGWVPPYNAQEAMARIRSSAGGEIPRIPQQPAVSTAAAPAQAVPQAAAAQQTERISDIVKFLDDQFVPIRVGRFNKMGALGIYKVKPEVVRVKQGLDLDTISHELGHHLDKQFGLWKSRHIAETTPLVQVNLNAPAYKTNKAKLKEHVAEFLRVYLTDPAQAQNTAPNFYREFEAALQGEPQLFAALGRTRDRIHVWNQQPPVDRIRGRISFTPQEPDQPPVRHRFVKRFVDELDTIRVAVEQMTGGKTDPRGGVDLPSGGKLPISKSPFHRAWLLRGWAGKPEAWLKHGVTDDLGNVVGPSLDARLKPVADRIEDFETYLVAKRIRELAQKKGLRKGFDPGDVDATIHAMDSPEFEQAAKDVVEFQDYALKELERTGLVDSRTVAALREIYQDYVPLYRVATVQGGPKTAGARRMVNLRSPIRKITDAEGEIVRPLESVVKNTFLFLNMSQRNDVAKTLVELGLRTEGAGRWLEEVPVPMRAQQFKLEEIRKALLDAGADISGADLNEIATIFRPRGLTAKEAAENIVTVWNRGKPRFFQLDPDLYRAMMFLDKDTSNALVRILAPPAKVLRAGAILSPEFIIRNPLRDQFMAFINSRYGYKPTDFFRGLFHLVNPTKGMHPDEMYVQWLSTGGAQATMASLDRDALQRTMQELLRTPTLMQEIGHVATPKDAAKVAGRIFDGILEPFRTATEVFELSTRLGEFSRAPRSNLDEVLAASLSSRDLTLDFSRFGDYGQTLNQIHAFWNANMQGLDKIKRSFVENPARFTTRAVMAITLPTVALYATNRTDERWRTAPRWKKDLFWMVDPVRIATAGRRQMATPLWVPKPFDLGIVFGSIPERVLEWVDNKDSSYLSDGLFGTLSQPFEALIPIPSAVLPLLEVQANYDYFMNRSIVPRDEQNLPARLQHSPYTPVSLKEVGGRLNISPRKMEHVVRGYGAGLGRTAVEGIDRLIDVAGERPSDARVGLERIPGLRGLTFPSFSQSKDIDDFYKELNRLDGEIKAARIEGRLPPAIPRAVRAKRVVVRTPETEQLKHMNKIRDQLAALRREREKMMEANLPSVEKRNQIDQINKQMIEIARSALGRPPLSETPRGLGEILERFPSLRE